MKHRLFAAALVSVALAAGAGVVTAFARSQAAPTKVLVYKDPGCMCCNKWVEHLRAAGFDVIARDTSDLSQIKSVHGVTAKLASCHTALVEGYVIEGHVPADVIRKLLQEHPKLIGLSVPGMVTGSPGMEGGTPQHYDVVSFDGRGKTAVYAKR